jgi:hypothetical protein
MWKPERRVAEFAASTTVAPGVDLQAWSILQSNGIDGGETDKNLSPPP